VAPTLEKEQEAAKILLARTVARAAAKQVNENNPDHHDDDSSSHGNDNTNAPSPTDGARFLRTVTIDNKALKEQKYNNLLQVVKLVCLHPNVCINKKLERELVNPYLTSPNVMPHPGITIPQNCQLPNTDLTDSDSSEQQDTCQIAIEINPFVYGEDDKCGSKCWQCFNSAQKKEFIDMPINKKRLRRVLRDIFIHRNATIEKRPIDQKHFGQSTFGVQGRSWPPHACISFWCLSEERRCS
jgi:hypothetical protein